MRGWLLWMIVLLPLQYVLGQHRDTVVIEKKVITLSEVIIRNNVDVKDFVERIKNDTSFYKAFRNLHVLAFTSLNDIRMFDKKGTTKASLNSKTSQWVLYGCRKTNVLEEAITGDMYTSGGAYNYYTPELYASLFFAKDTVCGQTNIVKDVNLTTKGKSGMSKHKEQLKMLFFNPGRAIPGLPFIGDKTAIFEPAMAEKYLYDLDQAEYNGEWCYVFNISAKLKGDKDKASGVVIDEMKTWFSIKTFEVLARNYTLSYNAGVYDFDVEMQVEMMRFGNFVVPKLLRYNGNWNVVFKKREKGVFTATLFDFSNPN